MTQMMDFTQPREKAPEPIKFKLDDDVFEAYPVIGGQVMLDTLTIDGLDKFIGKDFDNPAERENMSTDEIAEMAHILAEQQKKLMDFLDFALMPESREKFAERMRSNTSPITVAQAFEIAQWLLGQYGARPTVPSSPSENGHDGTGMSSMATAPSVE